MVLLHDINGKYKNKAHNLKHDEPITIDIMLQILYYNRKLGFGV